MSGKESLEVDSNRYLSRGAMALNTTAAKIGTHELEMKSGDAITVRAMTATYETIARGAIPGPERAEGVTKQQHESLAKTAAELTAAAMAAVVIVDYEVEIDGKKCTYDNPGGGDRAQRRQLWCREAAWAVLDSMSTVDIARILRAADCLARKDSTGLAAMVADAGKGSAPASKSSRTKDEAGDKSPS